MQPQTIVSRSRHLEETRPASSYHPANQHNKPILTNNQPLLTTNQSNNHHNSPRTTSRRTQPQTIVSRSKQLEETRPASPYHPPTNQLTNLANVYNQPVHTTNQLTSSDHPPTGQSTQQTNSYDQQTNHCLLPTN
jgi:hypothetical protein